MNYQERQRETKMYQKIELGFPKHESFVGIQLEVMLHQQKYPRKYPMQNNLDLQIMRYHSELTLSNLKNKFTK